MELMRKSSLEVEKEQNKKLNAKKKGKPKV